MWWVIAAVVLAGLLIGVIMLVAYAISLYRKLRAVLAAGADTMRQLDTLADLLGQIGTPGHHQDPIDVG